MMQRLRALRRGLLPLLAAALLAMQAAGLWHRVEHGSASGWTAQPQATLASALRGFDLVHDTAPDPGHHCAAIDSQTLADAPPAWVVPWCVDADGVQEAAAHAEQPFIAAPARLFHARAPPSLPC